MLVKDKVAFVTGGANGIGAGCSRELLANGARVIIADIDEKKGADLANKLQGEFGEDKVIFLQCDVSSTTSFKDAFDKAVEFFKQIDIMFNNAGIGGEDRWESTIAINLKGVILGTELALAHMRKDKGGKGGVIINMASDAGYTPRIYAPVYVASKYGVIGFTRSLASDPDLSKRGVRYACLCPDAAQTRLMDNIIEQCREDTDRYTGNIKNLERLSIKRVTEGFFSLIDDDDSNDAVLEINLKDGMNRKKFIVENK